MKNNDFDFIAEKFESENISAPDALSEENIKAKIEEGTSAKSIVKFPKNNKRFFKATLSVAAAIALVVVSLTVVNHYGSRVEKVKPSNNTEITQSNEDILYFTSYDEINALLKERLPKEESRLFKNGWTVKSAQEYDSIATAPESETAAIGASAAAHSETYKQVEKVDEADIVKTDGEYIYFVSNSEQRINICLAKDGKTKTISTIKYKENKLPSDLFIKDNSLVVISTVQDYNKKGFFTATTVVDVYNIKDKSNPKVEYEYSQSGYYKSSRMINDNLYIVSNQSNFYYYKDYIIPCATGGDGEYKELEPEDICAVRDSNNGNYTVVGALDIKNGEKSKTKAVIGSIDEVYCSENNLYITGVNYDYHFSSDAPYSFDSKCTIVKLSLDKTNIKITATGRVKGNVNSQYSMDEKDGYFRIATTKQTQKGKDINVLYILDEKLKEVGRVNGFAKNEHIEAVKYIGDMAYVITYEQTDPLFIIDLSDPENPEILGEVKISGFSTMLVPIDEKTLLGIGYSTEENEFGEATNGLKLALFDISNPAKPKVIGEKEFEGVDSNVQYEPKALVVNSEKNYFAIPATFDDYETAGALVFRVENGKIKMLRKFSSEKLPESDRCIYIDDFIYVLDTYEEMIDSFNL